MVGVEPYLVIEGRNPSLPRTGGGFDDGGQHVPGRGDQEQGNAQHQTEHLIRKRVLPALLETLLAEEDANLVIPALIAAARLGEELSPPERKEVAEVLLAQVSNPVQKISETAVAGLGVLAWEDAAPLLASILADEPAGRKASGGGSIATRTRAWAAYGLGLMGRNAEREDVRVFCVRRLARFLEATDSSDQDVGTACALALGRIPLPWSQELSERERTVAYSTRERQLALLEEVAEDDSRPRLERAAAVMSVGALLEDFDSALIQGSSKKNADANAVEARENALEYLSSILENPKRHERELVQSAAIAAGRAVDGDQDEIDTKLRRILTKLPRRARDQGARRFALIALGRAAGRAGHEVEGKPEGKGPSQAREALLEALSKSTAGRERWAALGLALLERERIDRGLPLNPDTAVALRRSFAKAKSPLDQGAFAIAIGLTLDIGAEELLLKSLEKNRNDSARGYIAVALGMIGSVRSIDPITAIAAESSQRPELLQHTSIALGLLRSPRVVDILGTQFKETKSNPVRNSLARALGRIGDVRSVPGLLNILGDEQRTESTRGLAAAALGLVCDQDPLPFRTVYSLDSNFISAPLSLFDPQQTGFMDLL